ncbi:MAG: hypothetical protein RAO94_09300 [Candidatus Stygibacter australis]|nr:hypothetical protein [Candidatus Stygibacter australis]MDP8322533.1 hypothetical protein [Candidatus Stygibacter australis]
MSFGKRCFNLLCLGGLAYIGYKGYYYVTGIINISRELPVYLKNVIGEKPSMEVTVVFNKLLINLSFSAEIINEHPDIADTTMEYITRYYPIFRKDRISIEIEQKLENEPQEEKEELEELEELEEKEEIEES